MPFTAPMGLDGGFDPRSDVFNRLLKNRVIMLGTDVNDEIANQLCAQLLYLEGEDANADIWLYINSPGGSVTAGMAIYDTMQFVGCDVATVCMGMAAIDGPVPAHRRRRRQALHAAQRPDHDAPAAGRSARPGRRHRHPGRAAAPTPSGAWPSSPPIHTGQPLEQIQADSERDRWFTAEEAKDYGLVDKVILRRGEIH